MKITVLGANQSEILIYPGHYVMAYRGAACLSLEEITRKIENYSVDALTFQYTPNGVCTRVAIQGLADFRDGKLPLVPIVPYALRPASGDPAPG
jgi:hypothetical protein